MSEKSTGKEIFIGIIITVIGGLLLFFVQKPLEEKEPIEVRIESKRINPTNTIQQVIDKFNVWNKEMLIANFIEPSDDIHIEDEFDIFTENLLSNIRREFTKLDNKCGGQYHSYLRQCCLIDIYPWNLTVYQMTGLDANEMNNYYYDDFGLFYYQVMNKDLKNYKAQVVFGVERFSKAKTFFDVKKVNNLFEITDEWFKIHLIIEGSKWKIYKITPRNDNNI